MNYGQPLQNPANNDGRYFYETGRNGAFQIPINLVPNADWVTFEAQSRIAKQPCWLTFLHVATPVQDPQQAVETWILLYDVNPDTNGLDALLVAGMPARYSFGPIISVASGGSLIYEAVAEEVPCRVPPGSPRLPPTVKGLPFNFGILAVASTTPRVFTPNGELALSMAVVARMQA